MSPNKKTASRIVAQLEELVNAGYHITIDDFRGFEVSVFERGKHGWHSHFSGDTLAEAMNRAYCATFPQGNE